MLQTKNYIKRSSLDRRTNKERRTLNLGPLFPGEEQRISIDRRQRFEDRFGWQPLSRLGSFSNTFINRVKKFHFLEERNNALH